MTHTDSIKDLGVLLDPILFFSPYCRLRIFSFTQNVWSHTLHMLMCSCSTIASLLLLYFTIVRSKLEHASPVGNNITTTDANKLEHIQRMFAALCFCRFFPHIPYNYACALELLKLHTLQVRRHHLDALFSFKFL
jgi:hypothetical protein